MAKQVLTDALIAVGGYSLADSINSVSLDFGVDPVEVTTLASDTHEFIAGLKTVSMGAEGFWEATPDSALFSAVGVTGKALTIAASGDAGDPAYTFEAMVGDYQHGAALGEAHAFSLSAAATAKLFRGTVVENDSAQADGNGTAYELGAVASGESIYCALHIFSVTGAGTLTVTIESDATNSFSGSETTRATFTAQSGISSEIISTAGAITDTWWRPVFTFGGGATAASVLVVLGIQ